MSKNTQYLDVSVAIPMRNASSTILETLKSIEKQEYPIKEIVIVDNASTDNSVKIVQEFSKKHASMHIQLLINEKDLMISRSLARGVKSTKTPYVILMHADCRLVSTKEFTLLVDPLKTDFSVVATYGQIH